MADAKIEIKVGAVSFSGEGAGEWLAKQLDKVLAKLPELTAIPSVGDDHEEHDSGEKPAHKRKGQKTSLAVYLRDTKAATGNQQRKFLAAAAWLQDGGANRLVTRDVTKALSDNNQGKLNNPAQCLINLSKGGLVVREGGQFYVSDEGRTELAK